MPGVPVATTGAGPAGDKVWCAHLLEPREAVRGQLRGEHIFLLPFINQSAVLSLPAQLCGASWDLPQPGLRSKAAAEQISGVSTCTFL